MIVVHMNAEILLRKHSCPCDSIAVLTESVLLQVVGCTPWRRLKSSAPLRSSLPASMLHSSTVSSTIRIVVPVSWRSLLVWQVCIDLSIAESYTHTHACARARTHTHTHARTHAKHTHTQEEEQQLYAFHQLWTWPVVPCGDWWVFRLSFVGKDTERSCRCPLSLSLSEGSVLGP